MNPGLRRSDHLLLDLNGLGDTLGLALGCLLIGVLDPEAKFEQVG